LNEKGEGKYGGQDLQTSKETGTSRDRRRGHRAKRMVTNRISSETKDNKPNGVLKARTRGHVNGLEKVRQKSQKKGGLRKRKKRDQIRKQESLKVERPTCSSEPPR